MAVAQCFRLASPNVVSETVEGEAVILNLETGLYYGLDWSASMLWEALRDGVATDQLTDAVSGHFGIDRDRAATTIAAFAARLVDEGLLKPADEPDATAAAHLPERPHGDTFDEPVLTRYEDIQELLLIDPIHEVDEDGWPQRPAGAASDGN